jgi:hypothetical protein
MKMEEQLAKGKGIVKGKWMGDAKEIMHGMAFFNNIAPFVLDVFIVHVKD